jgi:hypothetical protein
MQVDKERLGGRPRPPAARDVEFGRRPNILCSGSMAFIARRGDPLTFMSCIMTPKNQKADGNENRLSVSLAQKKGSEAPFDVNSLGRLRSAHELSLFAANARQKKRKWLSCVPDMYLTSRNVFGTLHAKQRVTQLSIAGRQAVARPSRSVKEQVAQTKVLKYHSKPGMDRLCYFYAYGRPHKRDCIHVSSPSRALKRKRWKKGRNDPGSWMERSHSSPIFLLEPFLA